ncbi:JAB domain-containing protein [Stutzerimonas kunmingensis]|uniref:ThiF family adenylyltransferase n=1 Tax=Stutzerimonas kunmingensis TaxID=1211807 RepID=UPI0008EC72EC|nr:ThiF family adenylyltransferase [Stutzerimonas kunmingensis]MCQ2045018.1 ThiF family adenylyltransferase [Stutzerimonas kunmingensis]SFK11290.1 JAB domain-containing protein [Stutzerimonas kunmingensis]
MRNGPTLVLSGVLHARLQSHLLPNDGLEAAAILLCTKMSCGEQLKLLAKDMVLVPYVECAREEDFIQWPGDRVMDAIDKAEQEDLALILIHSHPGGLYEFSKVDCESDRRIIPQIFANIDSCSSITKTHGSAIMVPGGAIKARLYNNQMKATPVELVAVYGDDIRLFWSTDLTPMKRPMAFTEEMRKELGKLTALVVGYSGTGSITAEQLARAGIGGLIVIDFDHVEHRNLNRIINSTTIDAESKALKVDVFRRAVSSFRPDLDVECVPSSINEREAVLVAARADLIFCCVDSEEGRFICDAMGSAFLQPVFDVGVVIPVRRKLDGALTIVDINGRVDYVQPGGASLRDRGIYSSESLRAEELAKRDPTAHAEQVKAGYMPGANEQAPSVITVNMQAASLCVQELIARLYPYRLDGNAKFAQTKFGLIDGEYEFTAESAFAMTQSYNLADGLKEPLLGLPSLSKRP